MSRKIKISQCMIVKNEEKNIRRALSWGKEILCEQIVVDTGSTDRTVEIAEEMGAKVYYFEWIGDFAAAKNYAIEQAEGDWIAFLDADEYYSAEDARKLYKILEYLQEQPQVRRRCMVRSALLELNDEGKVFSTTCQNRVFSNSPYIRYENKIHEKLKYSGPGQMVSINMEKKLSIYHTGYAASVYRETDKISRNLKLLEESLEEDPDNAEFWSYLGDSLYAARKFDEAVQAYERSLESPLEDMSEERRTMAYFGLMRITSVQDPLDGEERIRSLRERAAGEQINSPDLDYWAGLWMYRHEKKEEARAYLEASIRGLEDYKGQAGLMVTGELRTVYGMLTHTCLELGDRQATVRYGVLTLRADRYMDAALEAILSLLRDEPGQDTDPGATYGFLEKLYDFTQIRDRLYVMKAAKKMGFRSLYDRLYNGLSPQDRAWLDTKPKSAYHLERSEMKEKYPGLPCANETDLHFAGLAEEVKQETEEALLSHLKEKLSEIGKKQAGKYQSILTFYETYPYWGKLRPGQGTGPEGYEALEGRVRSVKRHIEDFLWLYSRLEDNRSRRTLYAILDNWLHFRHENLSRVREMGFPYFDTDLIPESRGEVYVDAGAYIGDSVLEYIRTYGEDYRRIYCYEMTPDSVENLKRNTHYYHDIEIRQKAAGGRPGTGYIRFNEDKAANQVVEADSDVGAAKGGTGKDARAAADSVAGKDARAAADDVAGKDVRAAADSVAGKDARAAADSVAGKDARAAVDVVTGKDNTGGESLVEKTAVELVSLDEDIKEQVGFLKIDVEGMEQEVLRGCEGHIQNEHPKLAVSVYHGYEELWKIPRMIESMNPAYRFYLRHYGGDLIPTRFILYAI